MAFVVAIGKRLTEDVRRAQLVEKGLTLFATVGYDALSTKELAKEAGVSKALLFHYFQSKRGYYLATIHEVARRVAEATAPIADRPFEPTLQASLEGYVDFVKNQGALYRTLVRGGVGVDAEVVGVLDAVRESSVELVLEQAGVRRPSPRLKAALLGWVAFTETTTLAWFERRDFSERALVRLLIDMCLAVFDRETGGVKR